MTSKEGRPQVVLAEDCKFVPVRGMGRLLWAALESAGISEEAAIHWGFEKTTEYFETLVRQWRRDGRVEVYAPGGFGPLSGDCVSDGVLRVDDFAKMAEAMFHIEVHTPVASIDMPQERPLESQAPAGPVDVAAELAPPVDAASHPTPLTTGDVAFAFNGVRYTEKQWKKPLGNKPNWLKSCVAMPGRRGVSETRWNPVLIGGALVRAGHASSRRVRSLFQTQPLLKPWLERWKTYECEYIDND